MEFSPPGFAFRLARALGLGAVPSLVAGVVYSQGGFFAAHAQHIGAVSGAAWIPLAIECVVRRSAVWLALALAMLVLAGFTPVTLVGWGAVAACAAIVRWKGVATAMCGAVMMTAAQLAPAAELMNLSVAKYRTDWLGTGGGIPVRALVSLVAPNFDGVFREETYRARPDTSLTL